MREVMQRANAEKIELHGKPSLLLNFVPFGINIPRDTAVKDFMRYGTKKERSGAEAPRPAPRL
jgi:hypothetical protein